MSNLLKSVITTDKAIIMLRNYLKCNYVIGQLYVLSLLET